jgi:hypothetical protein
MSYLQKAGSRPEASLTSRGLGQTWQRTAPSQPHQVLPEIPRSVRSTEYSVFMLYVVGDNTVRITTCYTDVVLVIG